MHRVLHAVRRGPYHLKAVFALSDPLAVAELLQAPLATTEFLALDTETNGLGGDACELTEIGAVLVGGGELHDRCAGASSG
jgi:DNA polymerase-3 subunit epsilon